ncbi:MAG: M48 family metallopeptidase, partial [Candidatus Hinthialibacter sp.]
VLVLFLAAGVFTWIHSITVSTLGGSAWSEAAFLFAAGMLLSAADLPMDWYSQFRLEERFGFNKTTISLWLMDMLKEFLLGLILLYPLLVLVLGIIEWAGAAWWIWAWLALTAFSLVISILAPLFILPLFNRFTPLPEGDLRDLLEGLARKAGVQFRTIEVMDGSRRSTHSNAFMTGIGRFRKIALFDTLLNQLAHEEIQAVLAHEMGHLRKKHILKQFLFSSMKSLLGLYLVSLFLKQPWLVEPFGFQAGELGPALLMVSVFASLILFWLNPLMHFLSRKYEYEADRFAVEILEKSSPLIDALRKLHKENLSNPAPHPWYSAFYYSHPTLREREQAMRKISAA